MPCSLRSIAQQTGIGAFGYYRRVVENQKNRLFDEIIRVGTTIGAAELLEDLEAVKKENQFTKAVDQLKHAIPSVLLVKGHNPLILRHKGLSKGILEQTDKDCLEKATSIRLVLADLAERAGIALKDDKELSQAESNLMK